MSLPCPMTISWQPLRTTPQVFNTMDRELASLREGGRSHLDQRSQSISVKTLIKSIETHVKSGCSSIHSR